MDKLLENYLLNLNFETEDIKNLLVIAPLLEVTSAENAFENIAILIQAGYPETDIDYIISSNPNFLYKDKFELISTISQILETTEDFEQVLKTDPFLI